MLGWAHLRVSRFEKILWFRSTVERSSSRRSKILGKLWRRMNLFTILGVIRAPLMPDIWAIRPDSSTMQMKMRARPIWFRWRCWVRGNSILHFMPYVTLKKEKSYTSITIFLEKWARSMEISILSSSKILSDLFPTNLHNKLYIL